MIQSETVLNQRREQRKREGEGGEEEEDAQNPKPGRYQSAKHRKATKVRYTKVRKVIILRQTVGNEKQVDLT